MGVLRALVEAFPAAVHSEIDYLEKEQRVKVRFLGRMSACSPS